jgi:hypothetical protein
MAGSAFPLRFILLAACLGPVALRAETSVPASPVTPIAPTAPTGSTEPSASAKLAKLFAGAPPKFEPPKPESTASAATPATADQPRNGIVHLPTYIVRGNARLPDEYHMLTPQARQDAVVKRYVGEPTGLDVLLNKYTINTLWKKIPLLGPNSDFGWSTASGADREAGQVYSSSTYGDRIALDYSKIEAKRLYLEALGVSADIPPSPAKPKAAAT